MVTVRDYIEEHGKEVLVGKTFSSGGVASLDFRIKDVYDEKDVKMVRIDGIQGDARFTLGSLSADCILDCFRAYS